MAEIISEEWLWIIIFSLIAILIIPFFLIWFILALPPELKVVATILLIVGWGITAGYKDWIKEKHKEEKEKKDSSYF